MIEENAVQDSEEGTTDTASEAAEVTGGDGLDNAGDGGDQSVVSVYDIDGEEVDLETIKKWKSGHMKDADYTQKTQKLSAQVKQVSEKESRLDNTLNALSDLESEIDAMVMGDLDGIDMDALRDTNPSQYLRIKEMKEERAKWGEKLSSRLAEARNAAAQESYKALHEQHGWADAEKQKADVSAIQGYASEAGITGDEFARISSPRIMTALLEAAKYRKLMAEKPAITKKVVQAPKTSKPARPVEKKQLTLAERMYGKKT